LKIENLKEVQEKIITKEQEITNSKTKKIYRGDKK